MPESLPIRVLVSLYRGYGLGDGVMMSAVLRHLKKHRPHWIVDYQAEEGHHCVGRGIVANTFSYEPTPRYDAVVNYRSEHYDREFQIRLYDKWVGWTDRPNTTVPTVLKETFDLNWDAECGRYKVHVSPTAMRGALDYLRASYDSSHRRFVGVQIEGRTAKESKDLTLAQRALIYNTVERAGATPVAFDRYSADAQTNCALIQCCDAFIGIDSGPSKCASATETPTLVVWTKHHPSKYHDPAPNTTHLVSADSVPLMPGHMEWYEWFTNNYNVVKYADGDPIPEIEKWLKETLR